jgi:hypothetical protein
MRKIVFTLLPLVVLFSAVLWAQDDPEAMKKWMEYKTPGPEHAKMAEIVGEWDAVVRMYQDPSQPPMEANGIMKYEMMLEGRYLKGEFTSEMMGMPMKGVSIDAFDNASREYSNMWIDNFGTGMMYSTGKFNEATKMIEMEGKMMDPMSGSYITVMTTTEELAKNHLRFRMYMKTGDEKMLNMEIEYKKK